MSFKIGDKVLFDYEGKKTLVTVLDVLGATNSAGDFKYSVSFYPHGGFAAREKELSYPKEYNIKNILKKIDAI